MHDLKAIFGQLIQLKLDHYLLRIEILNIIMCHIFFTKYAWVKSLKEKKCKTVPNAFYQNSKLI